jgi:hypothetical protein
VDLANSNSAVLTASAVGSYQVLVSNAFSSQLSNLVSVVAPGALEVAVPEPGAVPAGGVVNLVANVTGATEGRTYQWFKSSGSVRSAITGATSDAFKISPVQMSDAADYSVEVTAKSASGGTLTAVSNPVTLTVKSLPTIVVPLASRTVQSGSVTFRVVAKPGPQRSASDLRYRWLKDGQSISGDGSSITAAQSGVYTVKVFDAGTPDDFAASKATLTIRSSNGGLEATAGSTGSDAVHTAWWVYWVKASNATGSRKGYYALERKLENGVVTAGRSVWVLASESVDDPDKLPGVSWSTLDPDVTEHRVVDAEASDRSEFSVLASKTTGPAFTLSGRLEAGGDAALYGAADVVAGLYEGWKEGTNPAEDFDVELLWDNERTLQLGILGASSGLGDTVIEDTLRAELLEILLQGD